MTNPEIDQKIQKAQLVEEICKNSKINKLSDEELVKEFHVVVPWNEMLKIVDYTASEIATKYNKKGFRVGHVPLRVVKEDFGASILNDVSNDVLTKIMNNLIESNKFTPAIQPKLTEFIVEDDKDIELKVKIEIFPKIENLDLDKISLEKYKIKITQEDIDNQINNVLRGYKNWSETGAGYTAKKGDIVVIDYLGRIDGKEFEGGAGTDYELEIGSKTFVEGFEDQLIGVKVGETRKVKIKFPNDYKEEFAGQNAIFDTTVKTIKTYEDIEVTNDFVKEKLGLDNKEVFINDIKTTISERYDGYTKNQLSFELTEALDKKIKISLPPTLLEQGIKNATDEIEREIKINPAKYTNEKDKEKAKKEKEEKAKKDVKIGIIISDIARNQKIIATDNDLVERIKEEMKYFPGQENSIIEYYKNSPDAVSRMKGVILEEKVVDYMLSQIKTKEVEVDFEEFRRLRSKKNSFFGNLFS